jgi:hypothetical protein
MIANITITIGGEVEGITISDEGVAQLWPGMTDIEIMEYIKELQREWVLRPEISRKTANASIEQFLTDHVTGTH